MKINLGAIVETNDSSFTMRHPEHGESYHSELGALTEARSLYIGCSGLLDRFTASSPELELTILDVGLGLGYNALSTLEAWWCSPSPPQTTMLSLEIDQALVSTLVTGCGPWMQGWQSNWIDWTRAIKSSDGLFLAEFKHPKHPTSFVWQVVVGDALQIQIESLVRNKVDFIWQDAFSPTKNPSLWSSEWFQKLARCSKRGTTLMTYSVASGVRAALTTANWSWRKIDAIGMKRNWLKATYSTTVSKSTIDPEPPLP